MIIRVRSTDGRRLHSMPPPARVKSHGFFCCFSPVFLSPAPQTGIYLQGSNSGPRPSAHRFRQGESALHPGHPYHRSGPAVFPLIPVRCRPNRHPRPSPRFCRFFRTPPWRQTADWRHQPVGYDRAPAPPAGVNLPVAHRARQHLANDGAVDVHVSSGRGGHINRNIAACR